MTVSCSVYGLGLSVNVPLAGLRGLAPAAKVDVRMEVGELPPELAADRAAMPFHSSEQLDENGTPVRVVTLVGGGEFFRIDYCDGTRVVVSADGERVWARGATSDIEDTAAYLLGPVLGMVLRLRGVNCLHASAVAIEGRACAFVGASGAGKSSMAAAFARRGHAVLSDDVTPIEEQDGVFFAQPAYPRLRLWPESVEGLFGSADSMPRMVEGWDKRYVDLASPPYLFQSAPLPLAAIYLLDASPGPPAVEAVGPRDTMIAIVADTYATYLLDRERRAREFEFVARLVAAVPVRRLRRGENLRDAGRTCELVIDDLRAAATH